MNRITQVFGNVAMNQDSLNLHFGNAIYKKHVAFLGKFQNGD